MTRRRELALGLLALIAALVLLGWQTELLPLSDEVCDPDEIGHEQECLEYFLPLALLIRGINLLNHNEGAVLGLATIAIAWFTLSLRRSTDRLWRAGELQRQSTERIA